MGLNTFNERSNSLYCYIAFVKTSIYMNPLGVNHCLTHLTLHPAPSSNKTLSVGTGGKPEGCSLPIYYSYYLNIAVK